MYEVIETIEEISDAEVKKIMGKAYTPPAERTPGNDGIQIHRSAFSLASGGHRIHRANSGEHVTGMEHGKRRK